MTQPRRHAEAREVAHACAHWFAGAATDTYRPPLPTTPYPVPTPNGVYSTPQSPFPAQRFQDETATTVPTAEAVIPPEASPPRKTLGEPDAEMPVAVADFIVAAAETPSFADAVSSNTQTSISEESSAALELDR